LIDDASLYISMFEVLLLLLALSFSNMLLRTYVVPLPARPDIVTNSICWGEGGGIPSHFLTHS
jgi:hypothetical protein